MTKSVFISYAHRTATPEALALYGALGGADGIAFLDSSTLEFGHSVNPDILDVLFQASVVVAFIDRAYFASWYCLREFHLALAAYNALVSSGNSADARTDALAPVVIALPLAGALPDDMDRLPPRLRGTNWPVRSNTAALVELVRQRLGSVVETVGERLRRLGAFESVRSTVVEEALIPPPQGLAGVRRWSVPGELRQSIDDAFVGRADDLWQIHHRLVTLRGGAKAAGRIVALEGGGGSGKTRLATEYVHRFGPQTFEGGIFWLNADLPDRLEEQLHGILKTLVPTTPPLLALHESGRDVATELQRAIHEIPAGDVVLYVVDNVPEPRPNEPPKPLDTWCPAVGEVALLVTSRARQSILPGVFSVTLDVLSVEAARAMLTRDVPTPGALSSQQWDDIAAWVGQLPLALEILNAALRTAVVAPEELLEESRTLSPVPALDDSADALQPVVPSGHIRGITAALSVSYTRLPPIAQHAARLVAHLAPVAIPQAILDTLGPDVVPRTARALLSARSLVNEVQSDGDVAMFGRMHRVLAAFLRNQSEPGTDVIGLLYDVLVKLIHLEDTDAAPMTLVSACLPHANDLYLQMAASRFHAERQAATVLGTKISSVLGHQGSFQSARRLAEANAALAIQTRGEEHQLTLNALGQWATFCHLAGDFTTSRALEKSILEARQRTLGGDHADTLLSMSRLAIMIGADGDLAGAQALTERVLDCRRRALGEDHKFTLATLANLAELFRLQGQLTLARTTGEQALDRQRRVLGDHNLATLRSMNNLAATLRAEGKLAEAEAMGREVVEARRRVHGPTHFNTLRSIGNLAETLQAAQKLDEALCLNRNVLADLRQTLGNDHPETVRSIRRLAGTLRDRGECEEAAELEASIAQHKESLRRTAELG